MQIFTHLHVLNHITANKYCSLCQSMSNIIRKIYKSLHSSILVRVKSDTESGTHPRWDACPSQDIMHTHSHTCSYVGTISHSRSTSWHVFGMWEEKHEHTMKHDTEETWAQREHVQKLHPNSNPIQDWSRDHGDVKQQCYLLHYHGKPKCLQEDECSHSAIFLF